MTLGERDVLGAAGLDRGYFRAVRALADVGLDNRGVAASCRLGHLLYTPRVDAGGFDMACRGQVEGVTVVAGQSVVVLSRPLAYRVIRDIGSGRCDSGYKRFQRE